MVFPVIVILSVFTSVSEAKYEVPKEISIVCRRELDPTLKFAAEELQRYIELICSVQVPIDNEARTGKLSIEVDSPEATGISGRVTREQDVFEIVPCRDGIRLVGGSSRGTLYAVYEFLKEHLDCRWFYPGEDIVPRRSQMEVVEILRKLALSGERKRYEPDFRIRMEQFLVYDLGPSGTPLAQAVMRRVPEEIDWMTKNRMNVFQFALDHNWDCYTHWNAYRAIFPEMKKRGMIIGTGGHCLFMFMPREKFSEHPDWFPFINGKRQPGGQFCTQNEEAVQFYLNELIEFLKQNPEVIYFAPWPNDSGGWCQCEKCRETSVADRYMALAKQIYSEIKSKRPGVEVTYFAYSSHLDPPQKERPAHEMTITLCLWGRDLSVPLEDKRTLPRFRESLKQWQEISQSYGSPLVLHEKYARHLGLGVHTMPLPVLSEDLKYLKDKGVDGFELPMAYMGRWIKGLNLYVLARLMWDTNADTDAIIDDYFRQYYGAHSEVMREAFDIMERAHGDWRYWGNNFARVGFNSKVPNAFPMEITTHARKIIQGTEKVRKILADCEQVLEAEQVIRERINCFVACVDYWTTEWLGLIALAEGAELVSKVKSADTEERRQELLQEAEKRFLEAEVMNKKRPSLATQTDKLPMYWDVTGHGPDGVFQESQLEEWLNYLSEVEATGK